MNKEQLKECFKKAEESDAEYIAVIINMAGFPGDEIIINPKN